LLERQQKHPQVTTNSIDMHRKWSRRNADRCIRLLEFREILITHVYFISFIAKLLFPNYIVYSFLLLKAISK
jgi:hypothetical protein